MKLFENKKYGSIRVFERKDGEPWFSSVDVCRCLDISNSRMAVERLDDDEKNTVSLTDGNRGNPNITVISEAGLYTLVLSSRKPEAKDFKRWITHEVIPSIRRNGIYATPDTITQMLSSPEALETILTKLQQEQQARIKAETQVKHLEPKAFFSDCVQKSEGCIMVGQLAKLLCQNGVKTGQNRLFETLRSDGFLMWDNTPYQSAMEKGLFKVKESTHVNQDGSIRICRTTLVTGKGQVFFINRYANKDVSQYDSD